MEVAVNRSAILVLVAILSFVSLYCFYPVQRDPGAGRESEVCFPQVPRTGADKQGLSNGQREALKKLIPQLLRWAAVTEQLDPPYCRSFPKDGATYSSQELDRSLMDLYGEFTNKDVSVQIEVRDRIRVYVVDLKMLMRLEWDESLGFAAEPPDRVCSLPVGFNPDESFVIRLPKLSEVRWKGDQRLRDSLVADIVEKIRQSECTKQRVAEGYSLDMEIPDFQPGDPEIWVYLKGKKEDGFNGRSVVILSVRFDKTEIDTSTSLPDEVEYFSRKIRKNAIQRKHLVCRNR